MAIVSIQSIVVIQNYRKSEQSERGTHGLTFTKYLKVFLEYGEVPIDNNASERAIRGFCIGKKN